MEKTAFLYAGQGSQYTGMGKDLYESFSEFREVIDSLTLGLDVKKVSFENPDGLLDKTEYTQPCMVAFACGINQTLKKRGIMPDYVCGLSLGEYSALHMAGVWEACDTIKTVEFRGKVMAQASLGIEAGMSAVIGLSEEQVQACCDEAAAAGTVSVCNYNCPGQIVIGGEKRAVDMACAAAKKMGAKRCLPLAVSGPFHTSLMKPAGDALEQYFGKIEFQEPKTEVLYDVLGGPIDTKTSIQEVLVRQVQEPTRMEQVIRYLFRQNVRTFVEIGPGTVLSGFVKKTAKAARIDSSSYELVAIESAETVEQALKIFS